MPRSCLIFCKDKAVKQSRWPLASGAFATLLTIIALAGPTWERLPMPVFRNDSALVIALDLSRSMDAADIKPSRLVMARYKIADILKQRKRRTNGAVGLRRGFLHRYAINQRCRNHRKPIIGFDNRDHAQ